MRIHLHIASDRCLRCNVGSLCSACVSTANPRVLRFTDLCLLVTPTPTSSTITTSTTTTTTTTLSPPSLPPGSNSVFGPKDGPGALAGFGSPHHDTWNRLHRTPPSFPTPPQWPKAADGERSSSANSHEREREREREREKRDSSVGKEEKDKDR